MEAFQAYLSSHIRKGNVFRHCPQLINSTWKIRKCHNSLSDFVILSIQINKKKHTQKETSLHVQQLQKRNDGSDELRKVNTSCYATQAFDCLPLARSKLPGDSSKQRRVTVCLEINCVSGDLTVCLEI